MARILCPHCTGRLVLPSQVPTRRVRCSHCHRKFFPNEGIPAPKPSRVAQAAGTTVDYEVLDDEPVVIPELVEDVEDNVFANLDESEETDNPPARAGKGAAQEQAVDTPARPSRPRRHTTGGRKAQQRDRSPEKLTPDQLAALRTGVFLNVIGMACQAGACAIMALLLILSWAGLNLGEKVFLIAVIPGIAAWLIAAVGGGFLLAGPQRPTTLGFAVGFLGVAVLHAILMLVTMKEADTPGFLSSSSELIVFVTQLPVLVMLLPAAVNNVLDSMPAVLLTTAFLEFARFIVLLLTVRHLAELVRDRDTPGQAMAVMIVLPGMLIGLSVFVLIFSEIFTADASNARLVANLLMAGLVLLYACIAGLLAWTAVVLQSGVEGIDRRR